VLLLSNSSLWKLATAENKVQLSRGERFGLYKAQGDAACAETSQRWGRAAETFPIHPRMGREEKKVLHTRGARFDREKPRDVLEQQL